MNKRIIELRSMPYDEYLKTQEWAAIREQALERDGRRCRACNSDTKLNVHHRTYERRGCEFLNDLTTLCQRCHEHFHKRMSQDEIMGRTYSAPGPDLETRRKESVQKWEYYLVGLLLQRPDLYACVCGILTECDLIVEDARALYSLFNAPANDDKPIQERIPQHLENAASQALESAQLDELVTFSGERNEALLTKTIVQSAIRIKEHRLLELNTQLKMQLQQASAAGDKETEKQYFQQFMDVQRQLHTLTAAKRLPR